MIPFLAEKLEKKKFVRKDAISSGSISSLMNIDIYVYDTNNHVTNKNIVIRFAARICLIKEDLGVAIEAEFKHQCLSCYQSICSKLKERSPLKYEFVSFKIIISLVY